MQKLSAKPVTDLLYATLKTRVDVVRARLGRVPKLSVILVGHDPASVIYTTQKGVRATALGMEHETLNLPATVTPAEVKAVVDRLNADPTVDGILIQRPLPCEFKAEEVLYWIDPEKDVDAFHPVNTGRLNLGLPCFAPCTPAGIMRLLEHYGIDPQGKIACVIGRSSIVGKPMATLLLQANATVIHCHSRTPDLPSLTRQADILIVAAGKPGLIDGEFIKESAVVVDVGIHRDANNKLVGDTVFESIASKASAATPVPGGVGPMTIALLMENTVSAAERKPV